MASSGANDTGLLQCAVGSVFVDGLEPACAHSNADELLNLGHPDAVLMQIRMKFAPHILGHVTSDATLFFGQTTAMNDAAARNAGPGDTANLRHRRDRAMGPD